MKEKKQRTWAFFGDDSIEFEEEKTEDLVKEAFNFTKQNTML